MNIDSIDDLKKLAGLINMTPVTVQTSTTDTAETSCGCGDTAEPVDSREQMRKYMDAMPVENSKMTEEELEEWANSTEHFDGEPRIMDQPKGEIVDTSLRRYLGAKGHPVKVEESVDNDDDDDETPMEDELEEAYVHEGVKDKLKMFALLGMMGVGAGYALDATSAKNSPLGKALYQAAQEGDSEAAMHYKNISSYVEGNDTGMLKMLKYKYMDENKLGEHTAESMMESYDAFKNNKKMKNKKPTEKAKVKSKPAEMVKESIDLSQLKKNAGLL